MFLNNKKNKSRDQKMTEQIIKNTIEYVKQRLSDDYSGHDWEHIRRVYHLALKIQSTEGGDVNIVSLAALLHDMADWKLFDEEEAYQNIKNFLLKSGIEAYEANKIISIIKEVSYKGNQVDTTPSSLEAKIVQDADRLDAIGAIGIARAFAYGAKKNRKMFHPEILPQNHKSFEEYKKSESTTINHFYEKLLLLKDLLNTDTGRRIGEKRHHFLEAFLNDFLEEWNGNI